MKQNILSMFSQLLATENITVRFQSNVSPSFQTDSRVLTLPILNIHDDDLYDMFVVHEVGHALFTDHATHDANADRIRPFFKYVNIIEDARIEMAMKAKFNGASRVLAKGYDAMKDMSKSSKWESISEIPFIERINEYFSFGEFSGITFSEEEQPYVARIYKLSTFLEAIDLAEEIYNKFNNSKNGENGDEGKGSGEDGTKVKGKLSTGDDTEDEELPEPSFYDAKEQFFEVSVEKSNVEITEVTVDELARHTKYIEWGKTVKELEKNFKNPKPHPIAEGLKTIISYALSEFEMKKSARKSERVTQAKTGMLDNRMLAKYQYADNIFKSVGVTERDKNHGIIFLLDWSSSMDSFSVLRNTLIETVILCSFCKKIKIPFKVATFTTEISNGSIVREILTSDMPSDVFDDMCSWLLNGNVRSVFKTGSTPTSEALAKIHNVMGQFIREYRIEKPILIVLTDGSENWNGQSRSILKSKINGNRYGRNNGGVSQFDVVELIKNDYNVKCIGYSVTAKMVESEVYYICPEPVVNFHQIVEKYGYYFHKPKYSYDIIFAIEPSDDVKKRKTILKHFINEVA